MRDWDVIQYSVKPVSKLDYITYERLRLELLLFYYLLYNLWITLPMRDWDRISVSAKYESVAHGLHYLWEIETSWLKLINFFTCKHVKDYITYERLRLYQNVNLIPWYHYGDYITYERLRRWHHFCTFLIWPRITLPMRDWDTPRDKSLTPGRINGLHYLWEIETYSS